MDEPLERTDSCGSGASAGSPRRRRASSAGGPSYSLDLYEAFPQVCHKAKGGVQLCHAVASLLAERAAAEQQYALALLKTAQGAAADDWASHLTGCWAAVLMQMELLAKERAAFATTLQASVVPGAKAFATQHESQVQRLISEGTKVRAAYHQITATMDRAKEKYDRKCAEAAEIAAALRKLDAGTAPSSQTSGPTSPTPPPSLISAGSSSALDAASSAANGIVLADLSSEDGGSRDKVGAGAGQLLTKMWDSTSAFGRSPVDRQRSKLDSCLEDVLAAEKHYVQAVEVMNAQRPIFEREIKENLHAFQLTEEQRLEYLKDVLIRVQKAFLKIFPRAKEIVEQMRASAQAIDELADIEQAFQQLGPQPEVDVNGSDLANNPYFNRVVQIQALSDSGHRTIGVISGAIMELTATEDRHTSHLRKLLRVYEHGNSGSSMSTAADLFGSTSSLSSSSIGSTSPNHPGAKFIHSEGVSMALGWQAIKDEVQLLLEIHQEYRSLLSEPVALSLETMKIEYETTCAAAQENFVKVHSSLCFESSSHLKLRQKLDGKLRDFNVIRTASQDGKAPESKVTCTTDAERVVAEMQAAVRSAGSGASERERRTEQKLRQLTDEMVQLDSQLSNSLATLKDKFHLYVQDIEIFVSTYMKNEKFRLQVAKSSLQSFAKALRHMIAGNLTLATQSLEAFERIDASTDILAFIETNRKPYQRNKRTAPAFHSNEALREALRNYQHIPGIEAGNDAARKEPNSESGRHSQALRPARPTDSTSPRQASTPQSATGAVNGLDDDICNESDHGEENMDAEDYETVDDGGADARPLGLSDFQKKFKLSSVEQVVESYSCALYLSNFPYHGRLYLTRDHMCFAGWRDTIYVAPYTKISSMEKKNTALIVPNAIELMVKGERVFFASFVFRDECYQCIQQLRAIKIGTDAILGGKTPHEASDSSRASDQDAGASVSAPNSGPECIDTKNAEVPDVNDNVEVEIPPDDPVLKEFELIMNDEVPFRVEDAYSTLWVGSNEFARGLLETAGSTSIEIGDWNVAPLSYIAAETADAFDASRTVSCTHNKKYIVGPGAIPTLQVQRYRYSPGSRLVISVTTTISNVPYCDYFRVEHRWVFSATKNSGKCLAQVGIHLHWLKSTWLKKQIESTTVTESKDATVVWFDTAKLTLQKQSGGMQVQRASSTSSTAEALTDNDVTKDIDASETARSRAKSSASTFSDRKEDANPSMHTGLQLLALLCALLFLYALLRVCTALEQMQLVTREMLLQQQQQQEFYREMLARLVELNERR